MNSSEPMKNSSYNIDQDNILSFCYTYKRSIGVRRNDMDDTFMAVYGENMVGWDVGVDKFSELPFPAILTTRFVSKYSITLVEDSLRDTYPEVLNATLKIRLLDNLGSVCSKPIIIHFDNEQRLRGRGFRTESNTEVGNLLKSCFDEHEHDGKTIEIGTVVRYKLTEFSSITISEAARPIPIQLDFYFNSLFDSKRHDFVITAPNGKSIKTSKEALFISSPFFRTFLTPAMTEYNEEGGSIEAIEIVLAYLFTDHYKPPSQMKPALALEIIHLAATYRAKMLKALRRAVEKHCLEELKNNKENLDYVVQMMIASQELLFSDLLSSCCACIISYNFKSFVEEYLNPDHQLYSRLTRNTFLRPPLGMKIKRDFLRYSLVRTCVSKIPSNC